MIKRIRTVETHNYPLLDFTGVSTKLNLSHMVLKTMFLGGAGLYLIGLSDSTKRKKNWKAFIFYKSIRVQIKRHKG